MFILFFIVLKFGVWGLGFSVLGFGSFIRAKDLEKNPVFGEKIGMDTCTAPR
jgi:hypothetical protein